MAFAELLHIELFRAQVLGVLANDQDANVLKDVCKGFVCLSCDQPTRLRKVREHPHLSEGVSSKTSGLASQSI